MNRTEILKIIGYFDYFNYPLSKMQIFQFLNSRIANIQQLDVVLDELLIEQKIEQKDQYYSVRNIEQLLTNRLEGEQRFRDLQNRIDKTGKRLSFFPFIKFVGLSGSLSKGYASKNADIDLFIITKKNRLWICRTILHIFKKLSFLKGSQHWYCMNYFIDESALQIEEQNYFTAIELCTLKPLVDASNYHQQLIENNAQWIATVLPNYQFKKGVPSKTVHPSWWTKLFEFLSSDALNIRLMKWTDLKWRRKWVAKNFPQEDYELAFKTRVNISKNHLHNYQKKLLEHLDGIQKANPTERG